MGENDPKKIPDMMPGDQEATTAHDASGEETEARDPGDEKEGKPEARWRKTELMRKRIQRSPFYEEPDAEAPHGRFKKRALIGRDTRINGGIYLGAGGREAIVVDGRHKGLRKVYDELAEEWSKRKGRKSDDAGTMRGVFDLVRKHLPYRSDIVEQVFYDELEGKEDQKVSLEVYIDKQGGECRHQALLGGYLLERMIDDGLIGGKVSVDRNFVPGQGGHAWIRYTSAEGKVFIIDPARNYIGELEDTSEYRWFYERPEDKERIFSGDKRILAAVARNNLIKFKEWLLSAYHVDEQTLRRGIGERMYALLSGDTEEYFRLLRTDEGEAGDERIIEAIATKNVPYLKKWILEKYEIDEARLRAAFGQAYRDVHFDYEGKTAQEKE
jgi:hypothetical protein